MRRTARENAFKLLFEQSVSGATGDITYAVLMRSMTEEEQAYFNEIISGVKKAKDFIDIVINRFARGFDPERIYKIDRAVLQVAVYEILFNDGVPDKVAVNEALEMAKIYSTDNSPSFINGILASVIREKSALTEELNASQNKDENGENALDADENDEITFTEAEDGGFDN